MLKKIQGRWQSQCSALPAGPSYGHRKTQLIVSFTHFVWETREYHGDQCLEERARWQARYRFRLGDALTLTNGDVAYAIDFENEENTIKPSQLAPLNLIWFERGQLFLGQPIATDTPRRLERLDYQNPFVR